MQTGTTGIHTTQNITAELDQQHYTVVRADALSIPPELVQSLDSLLHFYETLPVDEYLPAGGKYRFRRFGRCYYLPVTGEMLPMPHVDYFQSAEHNRVTGGIVRKFAPLLPQIFENSFIRALIAFDLAQFPLTPEMRQQPWQVDVHLIRVIAQPDIMGEPTPEGIHRDGAEFVTVHLAEIDNTAGGEVTIYDPAEQPIHKLRLHNILDSYFLRDTAVLHGVSPIVSADNRHRGVRSILTFDYHYAPGLEKPSR
jgi:hypothetical protein